MAASSGATGSGPRPDAGAAQVERDPFDEFNQRAGMGFVEDPYPFFALARQRGPIAAEHLEQMAAALEAEDPAGAVAGGGDRPSLLDHSMLDPARVPAGIELPPVFTAFGFEAVQTVLRDGVTFSSSGYADVIGAVMGHTILEMDEPEHGRYRRLIQQAFTRKEMERWERDAVAPIVGGLIDRFADRGHADLVRELTFPFPVHVIASLLGLPHEDLPRFHRWAVELISVSFDWDRGVAASTALRDYFAGILAQRRAEPSDDVISVLAAAELDGTRLTDEEIFAFLRLLLPAGAETTYRSSSNLLFGLLRDPDQLDAVRADPGLLAAAIEEGLRWEPPLLTIMRRATRDTEVCGVPIPAGAAVIVNLGSANHDEQVWDDAERFDLFREPQPHLAFATGPHMCLGMHLARMETRVVLEQCFARLPELRLDPDAPPPSITGMVFRAPTSLPVRFG